MTLGELDVEVGDQGLHVVIALDLQVEGGGEGDVLLGAGLDVDLLDQTGVGHHLCVGRYQKKIRSKQGPGCSQQCQPEAQ